MFAWRTTWIVKPGSMQRALEWFETHSEEGPATFRVYTPRYSPNVLVFEETWETEEEHDQFWADLNAAPESAAMFDTWNGIVERSTGTELWNLREWR